MSDMTRMELTESYWMVAAIDFGTTYSGYALSFRDSFLKDPSNIQVPNWHAGTAAVSSAKTTTSILFSPDGKVHSFGYEAEDHYSELVMDEKDKGWYFFRWFKMELYRKKVDRHLVLTAFNGKRMPAIKVIAGVISYLRTHLLDLIKQQAGIPADQLILSLEPEAASIWCKQIPVTHMVSGTVDDQTVTLQSGTKYMVLDAGGGTIDITVQQVTQDGHLKEIYAANGGDWGGAKVNEEFENVLQTVAGQEEFMEFKHKNVSNLLDIYRDFEVKKRTLTEKYLQNKVTFRIPLELSEIRHGKNPGEQIDQTSLTKLGWSLSDIEMKRDKLRLSAAKTKTLFEPSFRQITDHVFEILRKPEVEGCKAILMVGGYSECPLLQDEIRTIAGGVRLIVPSEAGLAVLKGAVINGHCPDTVSQRICKYTYGTCIRTSFIDGVHREDYRVTDEEGVSRCKNCFAAFITQGTHIHIGTSSVTQSFSPSTSTQKSLFFGVFASTSADPMYVTDDSCRHIGDLKLDVPDTSLGLHREANVTMYFGGSEIEVKAVDKHTGHEVSASVNFLG